MTGWTLSLVMGALPGGAPGPSVAADADADAALVARIRGGDRAAFEALYRRYAAVVFGRLSRLIGPVAERDDLTQDVFLGLYRALPSFRGDASVSTLLYRITANVACDHLRRRGRRPSEPLEAATLATLISDDAGPEERARRGEAMARVLAALDRITAKKRVALLLRVVEGLGFAEIGAIVGSSADTAKKRALHGMRELTALLGGAMTAPPPRVDDAAHDDVRAALRLDDRLDDLRRARLWGQLDRALDAAPPRVAPPWGRRRAFVVGGGVALAMAAGAAAIWMVARGGGGGGVARRGAQQVLEVPVGASARAQLGPAAAVTLYGPARLAVERTEGDVDVTLGRGMLAGDYDHARGGRMRVRTPHAVVEIVGTVFAIEVTDETCVAVADGQVRVTATAGPAIGQAVQVVRAGQRFCVGAAAVGPVPRELEERMEAHAGRTIVAVAPAVAAPLPAVAAVTSPAPAMPVVSPPAAPRTPRVATVAAPSVVADVVAPAPASPPALAPAPAEPVVDAAAELYATAEQAMKYDDTEFADALLARLVVDHPASDLIDEALFERARLAYGRGAWNAARASLDRLLAGGPTPLRAPARFLLCRIAVRTGDRDAGRCLDELRRDAPDARFALEALELRVQVAFDHGGCTAAAPFILELRTAAPSRATTATWARRCPPEAP